MMRVYIAGCGGMLGDAVYKHFSRHNTVKATDIVDGESWLGKCDVRNYHPLLQDVKDFRPDVIINLAAITDLEECEVRTREAVETNAGGAANMAVIASRFDVPIVYLSSAGIFDGAKASYDDDDLPNTLSVYGKTKYYGELITRTVPKHYVLRPVWMMGGGPKKDKKFINLIFKQIMNGAKTINAVSDRVGTPTYTHDLAKNIEVLLLSGKYGVYNCSCRGTTTRYEVACEFVRLMGLSHAVRVNAVRSEFFYEKYFAPRPASERVLANRLTANGLNVMRHWKPCLAEYSHEFKKELINFEQSIRGRLKAEEFAVPADGRLRWHSGLKSAAGSEVILAHRPESER